MYSDRKQYLKEENDAYHKSNKYPYQICDDNFLQHIQTHKMDTVIIHSKTSGWTRKETTGYH